MTSVAQRAELQAKIWKIANDVRGAVATSCSLQLQAKKHFDSHIIEEVFWGQEINYVSSYVEQKDNREVIDNKQLNTEIGETVKKIDALRIN